MIPYSMNPTGISSLPYKRKLEYLESSTGAQYINTEYLFRAASRNSSLEMKILFPDGVTVSNIAFGSRQDAAAHNSLYIIGWNMIVGDSQGYNAVASGLSAGIASVIRFSDGVYSIDGGAGIDTGRLPESTYPFGLFAFSTEGVFVPSLAAKAGTRIYYCKFFEYNDMAMNLIPVIDKSDTPCYFDTVAKTFFYNAGTGNFNYS